MASSNLDIVIKAQDQASKTLTDINKRLGSLEQSTNTLTSANGKAGLQVASLTSSVLKANVAFAALTTAADLAGNAISFVFNTTKDAIKQAAAYEQTAMAFRSMLQDGEKAKTLLRQVSDFAAKTPFNLPDVSEGAKQLLAYNFSVEQIIPTFKMLGDVAAGLNIPMGDMVYLYGTLRAQNRAYTKDLNQFTARGIPILETLAKQFNVTTEQIFKMAEAGKISFPDIERAFQTMTAQGGQFFNLMEDQSKTFNGVLSNLRDNFTRLTMDIVGISVDGTIRDGSLFKSLSDAAQNLLTWINQNRAAIEAFGRALFDRVVVVVRDQVLPWLQRMGEKLTEYVSSPQFKTDMERLWNLLVLIGKALKVVAEVALFVSEAFIAMNNSADKVLDTLLRISGWKAPAMIVNLLTGNLPGLDKFKEAARQLKIPGFASGTSFAPGGLAWVGERGPELVNLPRGSQVIPNNKTGQLLGQGASVHIDTVNNYTQSDWGAFSRDLGFQLALRT